MDMGDQPHQEHAPPLDPVALSESGPMVEGPVEAESDVGEATSSLGTIEHPLIGDGEQAAHLSTDVLTSGSFDGHGHGHGDSEASSDALPSEVSPTTFGGDLGQSSEVAVSHPANTAADVTDGLQSEHTQYSSPILIFESPWGRRSRWGTYHIPEEFDENGRMTRSTEVLLERVEPYVGEGRQAQPGGSGILDTEDP